MKYVLAHWRKISVSFYIALSISMGCAHSARAPVVERLIYINNIPLRVEVAQDQKAWSRGLMFRSELRDGTGMLFVYPDPRRVVFWMKNTRTPLSVGFFNEAGRLLQVHDMEVEAQTTSDADLKQYPSKTKIKYALEVPQGWFKQNQITLNARMKFKKSE